MRKAQNEIVSQCSTIYELEAQLRNAREQQRDGDSTTVSSFAKLIDALNDRQRRFQSILETSICPAVQQLSDFKDRLIIRQREIHTSLQVALASPQWNCSDSNDSNIAVRYLQDENEIMLKQLRTVELQLYEEKSRRISLEGKQALHK